jgi:hypothetical protein
MLSLSPVIPGILCAHKQFWQPSYNEHACAIAMPATVCSTSACLEVWKLRTCIVCCCKRKLSWQIKQHSCVTASKNTCQLPSQSWGYIASSKKICMTSLSYPLHVYSMHTTGPVYLVWLSCRQWRQVRSHPKTWGAHQRRVCCTWWWGVRRWLLCTHYHIIQSGVMTYATKPTDKLIHNEKPFEASRTNCQHAYLRFRHVWLAISYCAVEFALWGWYTRAFLCKCSLLPQPARTMHVMCMQGSWVCWLWSP